MTRAKRVRVIKFAKELIAGKTQRDAAIAAGYSPGAADVRGSVLAALPETQTEIQRALNEAGLGSKRVASELKRGLSDGELNANGHGFYLDRLMKLQRYLPQDAAPGLTLNLHAAVIEAQRRGVYPGEADASH